LKELGMQVKMKIGITAEMEHLKTEKIWVT